MLKYCAKLEIWSISEALTEISIRYDNLNSYTHGLCKVRKPLVAQDSILVSGIEFPIANLESWSTRVSKTGGKKWI